MNIQIVIPTIETRIGLANSLAIRTRGEIIVDPLGDGTEKSATDNHVRAMLSADRSCDWVVILEDDADPIDDFIEVLTNQLSEIEPNNVVSLYLGKQRPPHVQNTIERVIATAPDNTSWLSGRTLYWGVGVCIPTALLDSVAEYVLASSRPWDTAVGMWALTTRTPVLYTWPSLVDHIDEATSISHEDNQGRAPGRKAWRTGKPIPNGALSMIK